MVVRIISLILSGLDKFSVVSHFTLDERQKLPLRVDVAVDAIRTFVLAGIQTAMCDFNNK